MSVVTVDDRSSRIAYSGFWVQALDRGVTINGAWDPGSQARFSFKGVRVSVFGVVPDGNGEVVRVDFQIDGGTPVTQTRQSGSERVFNELWWQSDTLSNTDHTLVMTYQRVNNANVDFRLDFIEYTTASDSTPSTPPPTPPTITVTTGAQPTSTPATSTQSTSALTAGSQPTSGATSGTQPTSTLATGTQSSNTPTNGTVTQAGTNIYIMGTQSTQQSVTAISNGPSEESPASSAKSQTPVGTIIGGSLGSMLVVVLAALAFLLLKRRRRRTTEPKLEIAPQAMAPYAVLSRGFSPAPSSSKSQMSQNAHVPQAAPSSVSVSGTTFSTSDSGAGLSYQIGPASDHVNGNHPSDLPPPAYDAHLRV